MLRRNIARRLYDTHLKRYVNIPEVRERLLAGEEIEDAKTGKDCSPQYLWRILALDMKRGGGPTPDRLRAFILSYGPRKDPHRAGDV